MPCGAASDSYLEFFVGCTAVGLLRMEYAFLYIVQSGSLALHCLGFVALHALHAHAFVFSLPNPQNLVASAFQGYFDAKYQMGLWLKGCFYLKAVHSGQWLVPCYSATFCMSSVYQRLDTTAKLFEQFIGTQPGDLATTGR